LLIDLVEELLDAHVDTVAGECDSRTDLVWCAHLEYLRAVQRRGFEILAATCAKAA
jgi:hypothetical protein